MSVPPIPPPFLVDDAPLLPVLEEARVSDEGFAAVDEQRPLSRSEIVVAALIFSGLVFVLGLAFAVLVQPSLVTTFTGLWPLFAAIGFLSTLGGFWWLWWRDR
jgi:hypothetical protein